MDFTSGELELTGHLALPERSPSVGSPGFVICHGFPTAAIGAARSGRSYHSLADRIASEKGAAVLAMHYRGCGGNPGDYSLQGWLEDVQAAVQALGDRPDVSSVSIIGFGTGAALAICAAARQSQVRAVAAVAPPADFADWSDHPQASLEHARRVGAITSPSFPSDFDSWAAELGQVKAVDAAADLAPRPLLVLHGAEDEVVPVIDSRIVADAHGNAELRIIGGAGHLLRYDPRAIAVILGWIDRTRHNTILVD